MIDFAFTDLIVCSV